MIQTRNRYEGDIDPKTKLRHGTGTYTYSTYYQYTGQWYQGFKHGKGKLLMGDGGFYQGDFYQGEIQGQGKRQWPDGREKHGQGELVKKNGEKYTGEWYLNQRQGKGKLRTKEKHIFEGDFLNHKATGKQRVTYNTKDVYEGDMLEFQKNGQGLFQTQVYQYQGMWQCDLKNGYGIFEHFATRFQQEGEWKDDLPQLKANQMKFVMNQEQEQGLLNAKQEAENQTIATKPNELFTIAIEVFFQGDDYEDPNYEEPPPEELEKLMKQKAKGQNVEIGPKMITPPPVTMSIESNRNLLLQLIKVDQLEDEKTKEVKEIERVIPFDFITMEDSEIEKWRQKLQQEQEARLELESKVSPKEIKPIATKGGKGAQQQVVQEEVKQEPTEEEKFHTALAKRTPPKIVVRTTQGKLALKNLTFPTFFPCEKYILRVMDVTKDIEKFGFNILKPIQTDLWVEPEGGFALEKKKQAPAKKK